MLESVTFVDFLYYFGLAFFTFAILLWAHMLSKFSNENITTK